MESVSRLLAFSDRSKRKAQEKPNSTSFWKRPVRKNENCKYLQGFSIRINRFDNIQQIAGAVQKGLLLIVRASFQQGRARLTRLRNELCSDSFHAVLAWSCGRAKCQCCAATVTVVVSNVMKSYQVIFAQFLPIF